MQQSAIAANERKVDATHDKAHETALRVTALEEDLAKTKALLAEVIRRLETQTSQDINNDGRIG